MPSENNLYWEDQRRDLIKFFFFLFVFISFLFNFPSDVIIYKKYKWKEYHLDISRDRKKYKLHYHLYEGWRKLSWADVCLSGTHIDLHHCYSHFEFLISNYQDIEIQRYILNLQYMSIGHMWVMSFFHHPHVYVATIPKNIYLNNTIFMKVKTIIYVVFKFFKLHKIFLRPLQSPLACL